MGGSVGNQPDREIELSQTNRGVGGVCVGVIPRVQSKLSRALHAHRRRGSTIKEGGDTTISSPGRSPKQFLPGIGLHDPLHDRQARPEFIAFDQGVGQICPR